MKEAPMAIETPEEPLQPPSHANGTRVAIALTCWLLSAIGVLMSLMAIVGVSVASLFKQPISQALSSGTFYLGLGVVYAWLALAVMTSAWVSNKRAAWHWPVLGGTVGLACSIAFAAFIPLYLPCALLGLYLCFFHLASHYPKAQNAA